MVAPDVAGAALLCSYARDAGTVHQFCSPAGVSNSCIPGCVREPNGVAAAASRSWCDELPASPRVPSLNHLQRGCASGPWRAASLAAMMASHEQRARVELSSFRNCTYCCTPCNRSPRCDWCDLYNELVLDTAVWTARLPQTIEAVFFIGGLPKLERRARDVHCRLLRSFAHTGLNATIVPLVILNVSELEAPFRLARAEECTHDV